ncbi:ATP synthase F0 subunit B [Candidatus Gracilibacteria bacterium]|nr:ATP synthase F0 subunit B [Candidatus Gracilibacteria bacterium]
MATPAENTGLTNLQFVTVETFVIQFIIILIVLWVLNKFVFRPYLAYLDEWEAKQKKVQEDYNNAESILEEKRKQGDELLEKARFKGNSVIEEAESLAKSKKDAILLEAQTQAQESITLAHSQIEKERQSMLSQIKKNVVDMTLRLNEKLFKDSKVSKDFIEKNIDSL